MSETYWTVAGFVAAAVVVNLLLYGGVSWAYFADSRRDDPPREAGRSVSPVTGPTTGAAPGGERRAA